VILQFRKAILSWYQFNKRDLPWRNTKDPYLIWLSEIILQQTRIEQGLPYYIRFMERFPSIELLANAHEDEVLKLWQGLGYYSRARNMHATARLIAEKYQGIFPADFKTILSFKGIGNYTASLIMSVCYKKPFAVLDGNVFRVLARLKAIDKAINVQRNHSAFQKEADILLDENNPGDFNQAMMELGALICLARKPLCSQCPVNSFCMAFHIQQTDFFPIKLPKEKQKIRNLNFVFIVYNQQIVLQKRSDNDIWKGLYQLPLIEKTDREEVDVGEINNLTGLQVQELTQLTSMTHQLTHQKLKIVFYKASVRSLDILLKNNYIITGFKDLNQYAFPKPIEKFLTEID